MLIAVPLMVSLHRMADRILLPPHPALDIEDVRLLPTDPTRSTVAP